MSNYKYILLFLLCILQNFVFAQKENEQKKNTLIEQRIELIAELMGGEDIDFTTLFDQLSAFYDDPIDLNRTSYSELQELLLLTDIQITNLFLHLEKHGRLISIYELQSISGWDLFTIRNILPFVKVSDNFNAGSFSLKEMFNQGKHEWIFRLTRNLEQQQGFKPISPEELAESPNSRYLGDPNRLYSRYRFRFGNYVSWGITAEKDPGEEFFTGSQKRGFDFYSGHLFIRNFRKIKTIAVGDYQVAFGQGLTFATGLAFGKSSNSIGIKRNQNGLRPYTSVDENLYMRGVATTISLGKYDITAFYSSNKVDGNLSTAFDTTSITDDGASTVSSLQTTGLHTTPSELEDRKSFLISHYGGHVEYHTKNVQLGVTSVYTEFGGNLNRDLSLYNQFEFEGNKNLVAGFDYSFVKRNFNFFGESSISKNGGWATINGVIAALDPNFSMSFLYRNYSRNYQSLFSNALSEGSRPANETGFYTGLELRTRTNWSFNAYIDFFESNWLRYQVNAPSRGFEYLIQGNWKPNKKIDGYIRVRHREKSTNSSFHEDAIDFPVPVVQTNYRAHIAYRLTDFVTLKNRVEWVDYKENTLSEKNGFIIYQDIIFKALSSPVSFTLRYALFDTQDYDTRIYAYENDILYSFTTPSYYYRGSRIYGIIRYQYKKRFDLWVRYGQWLYSNRNEFGSGVTYIEGNRRSDIKLQLIWKF